MAPHDIPSIDISALLGRRPYDRDPFDEPEEAFDQWVKGIENQINAALHPPRLPLYPNPEPPIPPDALAPPLAAFPPSEATSNHQPPSNSITPDGSITPSSDLTRQDDPLPPTSRPRRPAPSRNLSLLRATSSSEHLTPRRTSSQLALEPNDWPLPASLSTDSSTIRAELDELARDEAMEIREEGDELEDEDMEEKEEGDEMGGEDGQDEVAKVLNSLADERVDAEMDEDEMSDGDLPNSQSKPYRLSSPSKPSEHQQTMLADSEDEDNLYSDEDGEEEQEAEEEELPGFQYASSLLGSRQPTSMTAKVAQGKERSPDQAKSEEEEVIELSDSDDEVEEEETEEGREEDMMFGEEDDEEKDELAEEESNEGREAVSAPRKRRPLPSADDHHAQSGLDDSLGDETDEEETSSAFPTWPSTTSHTPAPIPTPPFHTSTSSTSTSQPQHRQAHAVPTLDDATLDSELSAFPELADLFRAARQATSQAETSLAEQQGQASEQSEEAAMAERGHAQALEGLDIAQIQGEGVDLSTDQVGRPVLEEGEGGEFISRDGDLVPYPPAADDQAEPTLTPLDALFDSQLDAPPPTANLVASTVTSPSLDDPPHRFTQSLTMADLEQARFLDFDPERGFELAPHASAHPGLTGGEEEGPYPIGLDLEAEPAGKEVIGKADLFEMMGEGEEGVMEQGGEGEELGKMDEETRMLLDQPGLEEERMETEGDVEIQEEEQENGMEVDDIDERSHSQSLDIDQPTEGRTEEEEIDELEAEHQAAMQPFHSRLPSSSHLPHHSPPPSLVQSFDISHPSSTPSTSETLPTVSEMPDRSAPEGVSTGDTEASIMEQIFASLPQAEVDLTSAPQDDQIQEVDMEEPIDPVEEELNAAIQPHPPSSSHHAHRPASHANPSHPPSLVQSFDTSHPTLTSPPEHSDLDQLIPGLSSLDDASSSAEVEPTPLDQALANVPVEIEVDHTEPEPSAVADAAPSEEPVIDDPVEDEHQLAMQPRLKKSSKAKKSSSKHAHQPPSHPSLVQVFDVSHPSTSSIAAPEEAKDLAQRVPGVELSDEEEQDDAATIEQSTPKKLERPRPNRSRSLDDEEEDEEEIMAALTSEDAQMEEDEEEEELERDEGDFDEGVRENDEDEGEEERTPKKVVHFASTPDFAPTPDLLASSIAPSPVPMDFTDELGDDASLPRAASSTNPTLLTAPAEAETGALPEPEAAAEPVPAPLDIDPHSTRVPFEMEDDELDSTPASPTQEEGETFVLGRSEALDGEEEEESVEVGMGEETREDVEVADQDEIEVQEYIQLPIPHADFISLVDESTPSTPSTPNDELPIIQDQDDSRDPTPLPEGTLPPIDDSLTAAPYSPLYFPPSSPDADDLDEEGILAPPLDSAADVEMVLEENPFFVLGRGGAGDELVEEMGGRGASEGREEETPLAETEGEGATVTLEQQQQQQIAAPTRTSIFTHLLPSTGDPSSIPSTSPSPQPQIPRHASPVAQVLSSPIGTTPRQPLPTTASFGSASSTPRLAGVKRPGLWNDSTPLRFGFSPGATRGATGEDEPREESRVQKEVRKIEESSKETEVQGATRRVEPFELASTSSVEEDRDAIIPLDLPSTSAVPTIPSPPTTSTIQDQDPVLPPSHPMPIPETGPIPAYVEPEPDLPEEEMDLPDEEDQDDGAPRQDQEMLMLGVTEEARQEEEDEEEEEEEIEEQPMSANDLPNPLAAPPPTDVVQPEIPHSTVDVEPSLIVEPPESRMASPSSVGAEADQVEVEPGKLDGAEASADTASTALADLPDPRDPPPPTTLAVPDVPHHAESAPSLVVEPADSRAPSPPLLSTSDLASSSTTQSPQALSPTRASSPIMVVDSSDEDDVVEPAPSTSAPQPLPSPPRQPASPSPPPTQQQPNDVARSVSPAGDFVDDAIEPSGFHSSGESSNGNVDYGLDPKNDEDDRDEDIVRIEPREDEDEEDDPLLLTSRSPSPDRNTRSAGAVLSPVDRSPSPMRYSPEPIASTSAISPRPSPPASTTLSFEADAAESSSRPRLPPLTSTSSRQLSFHQHSRSNTLNTHTSSASRSRSRSPEKALDDRLPHTATPAKTIVHRFSATQAGETPSRSTSTSTSPAITSPVTRSQCRYYILLIPAENRTAESVRFIVPACSLANTKQMEEDGARVLGEPTEAQNVRRRPIGNGDGDEVRLDEFIEQALTRIVGLDMVTEQGHVFYLDSVARTDLDPHGREAEDEGEGSSANNNNNTHNLRSSTSKPSSSTSASTSKRKRPSSSSAATPADNRFQGDLSNDEEGDLLASPTKRSRGTRRKRAKRGPSGRGRSNGKERENETEHGDGSDEHEE